MNAFSPPQGLLPAERAKRILGVTDHTLRKWDKEGKIDCYRTSEKGHRRYDVAKFIANQQPVNSESNELKEQPVRKSIIYARVSQDQESLQRQVDFLKEKYPTYEVITDIGSGINFKREGLKTILELAFNNQLEEIVVAYKDRLCRFAFELIEFTLTKLSNTRIVVLNKTEYSPEQELSDDIINIITVFSAKVNGRKRYKNKNS